MNSSVSHFGLRLLLPIECKIVAPLGCTDTVRYICNRAVAMRIVTLLIACVVFAALLVVDIGALLAWVISWVMSGPAYRWALLVTPLAIVAWYLWFKKYHPTPARVRADRARSSRRPAKRPQKSSRSPRQRQSIVKGRR